MSLETRANANAGRDRVSLFSRLRPFPFLRLRHRFLLIQISPRSGRRRFIAILNSREIQTRSREDRHQFVREISVDVERNTRRAFHVF